MENSQWQKFVEGAATGSQLLYSHWLSYRFLVNRSCVSRCQCGKVIAPSAADQCTGNRITLSLNRSNSLKQADLEW